MTKLEESALYEDIAEDNMTNGNAYCTPDDVAGATPYSSLGPIQIQVIYLLYRGCPF